MLHHQQPIRDAVRKCVDLANEKYGFNVQMSDIHISFKTKGRAAGTAARRGSQYYLEFSLESADLDIREMLEDTVPHEVAHLVCFFDYSLGRNHDRGWKRVCIGLGGTGNRTHTQKLTKAKYRAGYLYRLDSGREVVVGPKVHKAMQFGQTRVMRKTREKLTSAHFVRVKSPDEMRREHEAEVAAYKKVACGAAPAASNDRPTPPKRPARSASMYGKSKLDTCRSIWNEYHEHASRQELIAAFIAEAGCTKAGANTYYYKLTAESR
jgi:predicted SprT family Zn-dependent metalloprotease